MRVPWAYSLAGVEQFPVSGAKHPLAREAQRWILISGFAAITFGMTLFGIWQWWLHRVPEVLDTSEITIVRYSELGVPPSLARTSGSQVSVAQAVAAPPEISVPEPVPDELATQTTIMTQTQIASLFSQSATPGEGSGLGGNIQVQDLPTSDALRPKERAIAVDELPVCLSMKKPDYPEMAREAEIEGTVLLYILVGKDGKVKQVRFIEGPTLLRDAAIAAAKSGVFRPATMGKRPVEVWVEVPFEFQMPN